MKKNKRTRRAGETRQFCQQYRNTYHDVRKK